MRLLWPLPLSSDWSEYFKEAEVADLEGKFNGSKAAIAMASGLEAAGAEAVTKTLK